MQTTFSSVPCLSRAAAHAERGRKRRAGVPGAVAIVLAFGAQSEAIQAVRRADGVKAIFASGEQFVDVNLMADIPDEFVLRRAENTMQRKGQLDHAEVRPKMAAVLRQHRDQLVADFFRQLMKLLQRQFLDVLWFTDHFQISAHSFVGAFNR